ncbi:MAG: hypothetical protein ABW090_01050 [Sedimenticola sp.]
MSDIETDSGGDDNDIRIVRHPTSKIAGLDMLFDVTWAYYYATGQEEFPERKGGSSGGGKGGGVVAGVPPSKLSFSMGAGMELHEPGIPFNRARRLVLTDRTDSGSPHYDRQENDLVTPVEAYLLEPIGLNNRRFDSKLRALHAAGLRNAIIRKNNLLPTASDALAIDEIAIIIVATVDAFERALREGDRQYAEAYLALLIVLFYSSVLEMVVLMRNYTTMPEGLPKGCGLAYCQQTGQILTRPLQKELQAKPGERACAQALPVTPFMCLGCSDYLKRAFQSLTSLKVKGKKRGYLFSEQASTLDVIIRGHLRSLRKLGNSDVTPDRIGRVIFERLCWQSGDIADALLVTGRDDARRASQLYYTTRPAMMLSDLHTQTVNDFLMRVDDESCSQGVLSKRFSLPAGIPSADWCGVAFTPRRETIRQLVRFLLNRLTILGDSLLDHLVDYHNLYTAYLVLMLDFATGHRPTTNRYFYQAEFDFEARVVLLSEKDFAAYYNSRVVPLTDLSIAMLHEYDRHCERLWQRLIRRNPVASRQLQDPVNQQLLSKRRSAIQYHRQKHPGFLFMIDSQFRPRVIKPKDVMQLISDVFALRNNAHRPYLRSMLRFHEVPGEAVDAVMGHWLAGQRPDGRYSTLSIQRDVLDVVRPVVEQIMAEDGWRFVKSIL